MTVPTKMRAEPTKLQLFYLAPRNKYYTVPPQNYWSLCATRDDCICMQIFNCAIVL